MTAPRKMRVPEAIDRLYRAVLEIDSLIDAGPVSAEVLLTGEAWKRLVELAQLELNDSVSIARHVARESAPALGPSPAEELVALRRFKERLLEALGEPAHNPDSIDPIVMVASMRAKLWAPEVPPAPFEPLPPPKKRERKSKALGALQAAAAAVSEATAAEPVTPQDTAVQTLDEASGARRRPPGRPTKKFPKGGHSLTERCTECGRELGEHDGSECLVISPVPEVAP